MIEIAWGWLIKICYWLVPVCLGGFVLKVIDLYFIRRSKDDNENIKEGKTDMLKHLRLGHEDLDKAITCVPRLPRCLQKRVLNLLTTACGVSSLTTLRKSRIEEVRRLLQ